MGVVFLLIVPADVMKKRKVDQDLLVFLTETHSGMGNEDQCQHEDP